MAYIEPIYVKSEVSGQDKLIYVGFDADELNSLIANHKKSQLAGPFLGDENNSLIRVYPNEGDEYILVFKAKPDEPFPRASFSYQPLFDEQERLMICVNGWLYRYLVNKQKLVSVIDYDSPPTSSAEFYSLKSQTHQLMIIVTEKGLVAVDWDNELWKRDFDWSYAGYLEIKYIKDDILCVEYYGPTEDPISSLIYLNLLTGAIIRNEEHKGKWYYWYYDE